MSESSDTKADAPAINDADALHPFITRAHAIRQTMAVNSARHLLAAEEAPTIPAFLLAISQAVSAIDEDEAAIRRLDSDAQAEFDTTMTLRTGYFMVGAGGIVVVDPCYRGKDIAAVAIEEALPGRWISHIWLIEPDSENWGPGLRVRSVIALHHMHADKPDEVEWSKEPVGMAPVDSGQCGIFSVAEFFAQAGDDTEHEKFYEDCMSITSCEKASSIGFGVVSESGYGDGVYEVAVATKDGKVVGVGVRFIDEEEEVEAEDRTGDSEGEKP